MPATKSRRNNSWRTSASRRSHRQPTNNNGIDNNTYKLNPYKNRCTATINNKGGSKKGGKGLRNSSIPQVRGVIIDDDDDLPSLSHNIINNNNVDNKKENINILNDILNDDDELGLDNILSSISDNNKSIISDNVDVNILSSGTATNVKQQQGEAADSNNISTASDIKMPAVSSTANNNNNCNSSSRLPSNRQDISNELRLSDTTPTIQNARSNNNSAIIHKPSVEIGKQQQQIVSNIKSRGLDFDIENDIIPSTIPIQDADESGNTNKLLDGSDKRVPSSENNIPPEGALQKRLSESTPPIQNEELITIETTAINATTTTTTISGVTEGETTVSGLSTNSEGSTSVSIRQRSIQHQQEISPVSSKEEESHQTIIDEKEIDNDTLWTDGSASRQHKLQMNSIDHVNPTFTSSGFIGTNTNQMNTTNQIEGVMMQNMTNQNVGIRYDPSLVGSSSLVDSLIDDISLPSVGERGISGMSLPDDGRGGCGSINVKKGPNLPQSKSPDATTPLRGGQHRAMRRGMLNKIGNNRLTCINSSTLCHHHNLNSINPSGHDRRNYNSNNNLPICRLSKLKIHSTTLHEDETLSTVTDPTESPFIYTYQKRHSSANCNDGTSDSVSQITSSIAGSNYSNMGGGGTSHLQNIPTNFPRHNNSRGGVNNNLSWMNTSNGIGALSSSSRMIHRKNKSTTRSGSGKKKSIPDPYGRSPAKSTSGGNNRDVMIRSGSGSGGSGGNNSTGSGTRSTSSYNDIIDNNGVGVNDEIDYAMNNTNKLTSRRSSAKKRQQQSQQHRQMSMTADDLSTVESIGNYIDTESTFDVSRLGMGGVSMHQPSLRSSGQSVISEGTNTVLSNESTTQQGLGILHYLRKAQHHTIRYFFPKPPRIERRKKFDRTDSDDLEELLLEEGQQSSIKRSGSSTVDDEESTIDYYGSPGSSPTGSPRGGNKRSRHGKNKGSTARTIGLFILLSAIIAVYRMPTSNNNREARDGRYQDEIEFRVANSDRDPYDNFDNVGRNIQDHNNGQVLDYADNNNGNYGEDQYDNSAMISAEIDAADTFDTMDKQYLNVQLPAKFDVLANVDDMTFQKGIDIPFYWHVPRSGGGTMNDLLGSCLHLTLAADAGGGNQDTLKVLKFGPTMSFVNVDTSTHSGIVRAKSLNLASFWTGRCSHISPPS